MAIAFQVHYQLPRDAETYIHRSGRTARALAEGLAVALVSPDDTKSYKRIIYRFNDGEDLKPFPVARLDFDKIKRQLAVAVEIDKIERKVKKTSAHNSWFAKQAAEMDIELDDGLLKEVDSQAESEAKKAKLASLKAKLKAMLMTPASKRKPGKLVLSKGRRSRAAQREASTTALEVLGRSRAGRRGDGS